MTIIIAKRTAISYGYEYGAYMKTKTVMSGLVWNIATNDENSSAHTGNEDCIGDEFKREYSSSPTLVHKFVYEVSDVLRSNLPSGTSCN